MHEKTALQERVKSRGYKKPKQYSGKHAQQKCDADNHMLKLKYKQMYSFEKTEDQEQSNLSSLFSSLMKVARVGEKNGS